MATPAGRFAAVVDSMTPLYGEGISDTSEPALVMATTTGSARVTVVVPAEPQAVFDWMRYCLPSAVPSLTWRKPPAYWSAVTAVAPTVMFSEVAPTATSAAGALLMWLATAAGASPNRVGRSRPPAILP